MTGGRQVAGGGSGLRARTLREKAILAMNPPIGGSDKLPFILQ